MQDFNIIRTHNVGNSYRVKKIEDAFDLSNKEIKEFQEDIKKITNQNLDKLKNSIIGQGFILPFCIWNKWILDGHQRKKALVQLQSEGWKIPEVPAIEIKAKNKQEAKKIVLSLTSQHGEFDKQRLKLYIEAYQINITNLRLTKQELNLNPQSKEIIYTEKKELIIQVENEIEMEKLFNEFTSRGYKCKISTL